MYHSCREVDNDGGHAYVGSGRTYGKSLPSSQFSYEPKIALKKSLFKKMENIKYTILIKRKTNKKTPRMLGGSPMVRTPWWSSG